MTNELWAERKYDALMARARRAEDALRAIREEFANGRGGYDDDPVVRIVDATLDRRAFDEEDDGCTCPYLIDFEDGNPPGHRPGCPAMPKRASDEAQVDPEEGARQ